MLQSINRDATNMDFRLAAALGLVNNVTPITITGSSMNMAQIASPILLWEANTAYPWQTAAQALEIVSASAADTAAGTGARSVTIRTLDGNYVEHTTTITLNGITPVALPGTHQFVNGLEISSSGTGTTNAGALTLRIAGAGATLGLIPAGKGFAHAYQYTVPAGKKLVIDNFFFDNVSTANKTATTEVDRCIRLQDGTILARQINLHDSGDTPNNVMYRSPVVVQAQQTIFLSVVSSDVAGVSFSAHSHGLLVTA
jgi:hypothetical protein